LIVLTLQANATEMLCAAVYEGDVDLVQEYIEKGADVNALSEVRRQAK